jgi:hypothetical protein
MVRRRVSFLCLVLLLSLGLAAQTATPPAPAPQDPAKQAPINPQDPSAPPVETTTPQQPTPPATLDPTTTAALERLAALLAERREALAQARERRDMQAATEIEAEIRLHSWQFAGLAARTDVREYESPEARQFDLREEVEQLVRPLLKWLRDLTAGTRSIADQKARIEFLQERLDTAEAARTAAARTRDLLPAGSAARAEADRELTRRWVPTINTLRDDILVLDANLLREQEGKPSLVDSVLAKVRDFVGGSGISLLLAIAVFTGVFFGLRFFVLRLTRQRGNRGFGRRLVGIALQVATAAAALLAMLVVPYLRDDLLLLAVGVVFLIGAGWVVVRMLPQLVEQMRLVLNVGGVREGERLLVDGLPFRVEALNFYARLHNPDLDGGVLRVPVQYLVGKRSRPSGADEPWFPSRSGDVVWLADGTFGRVKSQTPEVVVIEHGGSPRSYPTASFLQLSPRNLSRGFVVDAALTVSRDCGADVTTTLRERLEARIQAAVQQVVPSTQLRSVRVLFNTVTPVGFELLALAECDGTAASAYWDVRRAMQRAFVDACGTHGWAIPTAIVAPSPTLSPPTPPLPQR